jgi:hypothetical protein
MTALGLEATLSSGSSGMMPVSDAALTEHLGELSAIGMGDAAVGNPAALFGEALERMRGFLKRADSMTNNVQKSSRHTAGPNDVLHAGPAQASLEATWIADRPSGAAADAAATLDEVAQHVIDSMKFALEADLVSKSSSQIGKSTNTLVKGQ